MTTRRVEVPLLWDAFVDALMNQRIILPRPWRVQSCSDDLELVVTHGPVTLIDPGVDASFVVGPFDVAHIQSAEGLRIYSGAGAPQSEMGVFHPNVSTSGRPCAGYDEDDPLMGWRKQWQFFAARHEWFDLLFSIAAFLQQWTTSCYARPWEIVRRRACGWPGCAQLALSGGASGGGDNTLCDEHYGWPCAVCDVALRHAHDMYRDDSAVYCIDCYPQGDA